VNPPDSTRQLHSDERQPAVQAKLDYADAVAGWFLELSMDQARSGELEKALRFIHVAATILCQQCRTLSSPRLEEALRFVAARLPDADRAVPEAEGGCKGCLHVLDEALPAGGLTAMTTRWIRNDQKARPHSVALLAQRVPVPSDLREAVADSGGRIFEAAPDDSFLKRAAWLRSLVNDQASRVVLHISVTDVICGAALGIDGGPPVVMVNHAAHVFWTGASVPDRVVNCRGSALERSWTERHRGIPCVTVPIPLTLPGEATLSNPPDPELRRRARRALGIPEQSTVILTVGAAFKYWPMKGLDFVQSIERVLNRVPNAVLLAVGLTGDQRWIQAAGRTGGRIRTLGVVSKAELSRIHDVADVYVEGFPFGSTTALLEAGLRGVPVVLPPRQCPPPFSSDGVALDDVLDRPETVGDYEAAIVQICNSQSKRSSVSAAVRRSIIQHHTGDGWRRHLGDAMSVLPAVHSVRSALHSAATPEPLHEYWALFVSRLNSDHEEALEHAVTRALSVGVRPRVTRAAERMCEDFECLRKGRTIPLPLLRFLCNVLMPVLPVGLAQKVFRVCSFLSRRSLRERVGRRVRGLFGRGAVGRSWYEDYRHARGA